MESCRDRQCDARGELFAGDRRGAPTVLQPGEGASTTGGISRPAQLFASDAAPILLLWATISLWKCLNRNRNLGQQKKQSNLACLSVEQCLNTSRTRPVCGFIYSQGWDYPPAYYKPLPKLYLHNRPRPQAQGTTTVQMFATSGKNVDRGWIKLVGAVLICDLAVFSCALNLSQYHICVPLMVMEIVTTIWQLMRREDKKIHFAHFNLLASWRLTSCMGS